MLLGQLIDRICADGIEAVRADYVRPDQADKLKGAIEGFELCQGITSAEHLLEALDKANARAQEAFEASDYWRWRCRAAEIDWVCNVVSAAMVANGMKSLGSIWPTCRGMMKAAEILGVKEST